MKRILLILALVVVGVGVSFAGQPSSVDSSPNSTYGWTHDTLVVSSAAPVAINAVNGFREVHLWHPTSTTLIYYRADNSSQTITTTGFGFIPVNYATIESNSKIWLQLADSESSITLRRVTLRR